MLYGYVVDSNAILDGFTISDGNTADSGSTGYGGGMYLRSGSEPTVSNCTFYANSARYGGAISDRSSSKPAIVNCIFSGNAARIYGGALYNDEYCGTTLINCAFIGNYAYISGGAVYNSQVCDIVLTDCMFLRNRARYGGAIHEGNLTKSTYAHCSFIENIAKRGGGVNIHGASGMSTSLADCSFIGNEASEIGGGFHVESGYIATFTNSVFRANKAPSGGGFSILAGGGLFKNCVFTENSASPNYRTGLIANDQYDAGSFANNNRGGGAYIHNARLLLMECDFYGNSANEEGGGLYTSRSSFRKSPILTNCTITGNRAPVGGGVFSDRAFAVALHNCTISGNRADYGAGVYSTSSPQLQNCIVWGNEAAIDGQVYEGELGWSMEITYSAISGGYTGEGNIDVDPLFVDPGYWDINETPEDPNDDFWVAGDYRLTPCSTCIDRGDPNYISDPNETDLDGNLRVIGGRIDMGAYEYPFVYDKKDEGTTPWSWRKYSENPIFSEAGPDERDDQIKACAVLKDNEEPVNKYKMWYVGGNQFVEGAGIGYATSPDGINWVRNENNPVLEPGEPWNADGFSGICVIKDGPNYKIWYEGVDSQSTARIGYATSPDGINWDINNSNPVFSPRAYDAWDNEDVGNPCVVKEGSTYKMWYWGDNILTGIDQIGLAVSNDGINWQRVSSEPVIAPDPGIWWQDGEGIGTPHVIRVNSGYVMTYHAADEIGTIRIGLATSSDGLDWKKENEPILYPGDENSWESIGIVTGSFIRDTLHLKLWYLGIDASETIKVGLAISCDDIVFDVEAEN